MIQKMTLVLSLVFMFAAASASAGTGLSVVAGASMGMPSTDPDVGFKSAIALPTAGVLFDFGGNIGGEIGALYLTEAVKGTMTGVDFTTTFKGFQFPAMVKFKVGPMLNLGVGGFYSMYNEACTSVTISGVSADSCGDTTGDASSNFGAVASVGLNVTNFLINARYTMGLKDLEEGDAASFKMSSIQLLVGYRFGFGK